MRSSKIIFLFVALMLSLFIAPAVSFSQEEAKAPAPVKPAGPISPDAVMSSKHPPFAPQITCAECHETKFDAGTMKIYKQVNEKVTMEKDKATLEKEIIDFLNKMSSGKGTPGVGCGTKHGSALVLATCKDNIPRATPLDFFNEGLTLYIVGEPGGKIVNLRSNPNVSAAIYQSPMDHSYEQKSLQIWGKATLITRKNNEKEFLDRIEKWGIRDMARALLSPQVRSGEIPGDKLNEAAEKVLDTFSIIKIEPDRITLRVFRTDFTMPKYTWTRER
jgi:nitroimidazol reductase NimA-like FMN-containing flavoprotein (pyridoxamine 5'-phosphate oxidase superfamily)